MGNKQMITQRYNTRVISNPIKQRKSLREKLDSLLNIDFVEKNDYCDEDKQPSWYVASHNKPKATDRNNVPYHNNNKYRYRRIRTSNKEWDIFLEPSKNKPNEEWHDIDLPSPEMLKYQQNLYNKLKREHTKTIRENNSYIRVTQNEVVRKYDISNFKEAMKFQRSMDIIRMSVN